jgi:hypothetical protein
MQIKATQAGNIRIKPLQLILVISAIQFAVAFLTDPMMFTFDESIWQYIGRNWIRNGMVPYQGGVDNKSPLIFLIYGISDRLFGVSYWFPRLLGIVLQSAGIFYLFKIAEKTIGPGSGLFAISLYGLSLVWRSTGGKYVSYTETYAVTCIIISVYYSLVCDGNRNIFIGGLFAGLGLGFRITAATGILPLVLFTFKKSRRSCWIFLFGISVSVGLLMLSAILGGIDMRDVLFYGVTDNFGSGSATDHALAWKVQRFADSFFYSEIILFYPVVFSYFLLVRKVDFLKTWLISEVLGIVILGMYDRSHFKALLPAASLMGAYVIHYFIGHHPVPPKMVLLGIWIVFFPKTFEPLIALKKLLVSKTSQLKKTNHETGFDEENSKKNVGLWIRSNTLPSEKVYVAGYSAQIQLYSERVSPSVYFNVTQTAFSKKRLFRDLLFNKPGMIVVPGLERYSNIVDGDIRQFISRLATENYLLDTTIENYAIYRYNRNFNH